MAWCLINLEQGKLYLTAYSQNFANYNMFLLCVMQLMVDLCDTKPVISYGIGTLQNTCRAGPEPECSLYYKNLYHQRRTGGKNPKYQSKKKIYLLVSYICGIFQVIMRSTFGFASCCVKTSIQDMSQTVIG
jgi:hypothetical protein